MNVDHHSVSHLSKMFPEVDIEIIKSLLAVNSDKTSESLIKCF